ncbi:hypothetical protein G6O67_007149 [Ophiocordyceps sinensis]|uniref:2-deoxyglucose-6-phosphate phosphatase n=1 Tax=Ophiocordyceps sinensis TaxID=72228 RepID=A0A8H4LT91_9HYPO|nr:hypothetical protein G6O67_007149 [Ophiocordyceps sinensis]
MGSQQQSAPPPQQHSFSGFLFDMDGTIIDSTTAIVKHWHSIGKEIGVSGQTILETSHGRRSIDVFKVVAPHKATWEYVRQVEEQIPHLYADEAVEIPGARTLLDALIARSSPWAIVTSGTEPLVVGWLSVLSLAKPEHLVTAESVRDGKPDPACYLVGLERLGLQAAAPDVLVLEDSPAGIRAGKAAGCKVVGLVTSHSLEQVVAAGPDWVVKDLESLSVVGQAPDGRTTIQFSQVLYPQL